MKTPSTKDPREAIKLMTNAKNYKAKLGEATRWAIREKNTKGGIREFIEECWNGLTEEEKRAYSILDYEKQIGCMKAADCWLF